MTPTATSAMYAFFNALNLEDSVIDETIPQLKQLQVAPKQVILRQKEQQKYGYFIVSGILKASHYSSNGNEHCKEYYFKDEMCFLYSTWLTNSPANYQIETLTDADLIKFPLKLLNRAKWLPAKVALLEQQLLYKEDKEVFLLLKTPEERYLHLLKYTPQWVASLNNKQLAHYIGISPISLSRIKQRIKVNDT